MKIYSKQKTILSDTITPVSIYLSLRDEFGTSLLLESSDYNSKSNHFSYICFNSIASISIEKDLVIRKIKEEKHVASIKRNPHDLNTEIIDFIELFEFDDSVPDKLQGVFGYSSFDIVQFFVKNIKDHNDSLFTLLSYHLFQFVLIFNHSTNELNVFEFSFNNLINQSNSMIDYIINKIYNPSLNHYPYVSISQELSNYTDDEFIDIVKKSKNEIRKGEVFQIVVSRKFEQKYMGDEFNVYRKMKQINPSPYMFFFSNDNFKLFGASPEAQLKISDRVAEINPIAGTYKRTGDDQLDLLKANELLVDPKENSEHVMLVDLARNDLSIYSRDVDVVSYKQIQVYSHVIHLVSKVSGILKSKYKPFEILTGTFPAGTLSGAPKHRALQLISELENSNRGFYGGTIGFVGQKSHLNSAIMIRSVFCKNNILYFQAGAGVVIDSIEEKELQEVYLKTNSVRSAIKEAEKL